MPRKKAPVAPAPSTYGQGHVYFRTRDKLHVASLNFAPGDRRLAYGRTREEALTKLEELRQLRDRGGLIGTDEQLLVDFLDDWLQQSKRDEISEHTFAVYSMRLQYVANHIGHLQLGEVKPAHIRLLVSQLRAQGLASSTVHQTYVLVRAALEQAVQDETIPRNPASAVKAPTMQHKDLAIPTLDVFHAVLDSWEGTHWYALFSLLGTAGCRVSEALALHADDFTGETVSIRHSLLRRADGSFYRGPTKTKLSRDVILTPRTLRALDAHRIIQVKRELAAEHWRRGAAVFTDHDGEYLKRTTVNQAFNRRLERLGLPHYRVHDLRHMCATLLLEKGMAPHTLAKQLGHSTPTTTLNQYAHVTVRQEREGADLMDLILAR